MAQIVFPNDFASQLTLLNDIIKKNDELGSKSPILAWLKEKKIDLQVFKTAAGKAQSCEDQRQSYESLSQTANQEKDVLFKPVFTFVMQAAQVLKTWYKPTYAALLDWGIPITGSGRIDYPSSFDDRSAICNKLFAKYATYDAQANPLQAFVTVNETDVPLLQDNLADANEKNSIGSSNAKLAESATAQRNQYMKDTVAGMRLIGDFLKSVYVGNPRVLGEWGFVVDEGNGKAFLRTSTIMLGETKTFSSIKLGSILTNVGNVNIIVYKGTLINGDGTILKPTEMMGMLKGYSSITITNTSVLEKAAFTVEATK